MSSHLQASPLSVKQYRTVQAEALSSAPGFERPDQYRAKVTEDMARKAIRLGARKWVELFLSLDGDLAKHTMPKIKTNPFSKLKNAHDMVEATISSRMVSISSSQW